jgi:hypothetical protein
MLKISRFARQIADPPPVEPAFKFHAVGAAEFRQFENRVRPFCVRRRETYLHRFAFAPGEFKFERFGEFLGRGVWPFLTSLIVGKLTAGVLALAVAYFVWNRIGNKGEKA